MNVSFGLVNYMMPSVGASQPSSDTNVVETVVDAVVDTVGSVASAVNLFDAGGSVISSAMKGLNVDIKV